MEAIARFISPNYLTDALVESLARDRRSFVPTSRIDILEDLFRNKGWMLRRSKAEVAHEEVDLRLPDINIKRVTCGFEPRQKRMYQRLIEELQVLLQRLDEIAQVRFFSPFFIIYLSFFFSNARDLWGRFRVATYVCFVYILNQFGLLCSFAFFSFFFWRLNRFKQERH